jgi:hypothetical protein
MKMVLRKEKLFHRSSRPEFLFSPDGKLPEPKAVTYIVWPAGHVTHPATSCSSPRLDSVIL